MNKTMKGALGASAAAVLLMGGVGSLAYWSDEADVDGGGIDSGSMSLDYVSCDDGWVYATGSAGATNDVTTFVPGDVVSRVCTFVIGAEGDNLSATPTTPDSVEITADEDGTSFDAEVEAEYQLEGVEYDGSAITEANDDDELAVRFTVTVPFGTDQDAATIINGNDTQSITATLDTLTVSLSQLDPNAPPAPVTPAA